MFNLKWTAKGLGLIFFVCISSGTALAAEPGVAAEMPPATVMVAPSRAVGSEAHIGTRAAKEEHAPAKSTALKGQGIDAMSLILLSSGLLAFAGVSRRRDVS